MDPYFDLLELKGAIREEGKQFLISISGLPPLFQCPVLWLKLLCCESDYRLRCCSHRICLSCKPSMDAFSQRNARSGSALLPKLILEDEGDKINRLKKSGSRCSLLTRSSLAVRQVRSFSLVWFPFEILFSSHRHFFFMKAWSNASWTWFEMTSIHIKKMGWI